MNYEYAIRDLDRRVWFLSISRFIRAMGRISSFIFLPLVFVAIYQVSFLITGLLLGFATLIMAIVQYFSGIWTDKVGRRFFLVVIPIPVVISYIAVFYIIQYRLPLFLLVVSWYITIVANSIQYPAIQAAVADLTSVGKRLSGFTILRVMANLGSALGPLIGGFLSIFGFQYVFLLAGLATIVEIIILYYTVDETYYPTSIPKNPSLKWTRVAYHDKFFIIFIIVGIFLGFVLRQDGPALTLYAFDLQKLPVMDLGYIYSINGLIVVSLQLPVLRLMTAHSTPVMWRAVGVVFYAVGFGVLAISNHLLMLLLVMGIMTVGEDFVAPTTQTIITTLAPLNLKGTYVGTYNLFTSVGRFLGTSLGLSLLFFYRHITAEFWIYVAIGTFVVSFGYFIINGRYSKRMEQKSSQVS